MNSKNKWLLYWIIVSIVAPLVSFIGGYGYLFVLALFYPLAQTIALNKIPHVKMPWLWLIHFVYWIMLIIYSPSYEVTIIGILASSVLGQILLFFMFGTFGKFQWLLFNTAGISLILLTFHLLREVPISNDFIEIIFIIGLSFTCAFLTGLGIKRGYLI